jgi:hypothetical protein
LPRPSRRTGRAGLPHPALQLMSFPRGERLFAYWSQGRKRILAQRVLACASIPCPGWPPDARSRSEPCSCAFPRFSLAAINEVWSRPVVGVFIFLRPFAPPALPGFDATMNALTASGPSLRLPGRALHLSHAPFRSFPPQPHPGRRVSSMGNPWTVTRSPLARQASPFPSRLARLTCRIGFTFVRDQPSVSGCSPPRLAATQLPPTAPRSLPPGR